MKVFLNFCVLIFILGLTLIVSDSVLKWYLKIPYTPEARGIIQWRKDALPGKRLKPNLKTSVSGAFNEYKYTVTTDENGFRNSNQDNQGPIAVVFLGDSQTYGVGVNDQETFASHVETLINRPVLNTACPGYNNIEQLELTDEVLKKYRPKYLVLCFFAGNDLFENYSNRFKLQNGAAADVSVPKKESGITNFKNYISKNSAIYNLLIRLRRFEFMNQLFYKLKLVNLEPPNELIAFLAGDDPEKEKFWRVTDQVLTEIKQKADQNQTNLIIVLLPDRYQVEDKYWDQWVEKYHLDPAKYDRLAPNRHLLRFCEQMRVPCVDTTEALRGVASNGQAAYWPIDSHLNALGHQTVAQVIAEHLKYAE